jgi:hypothetical protein
MQAITLALKWTEYTGPHSIINSMKVIFDVIAKTYRDDIDYDLLFLTKYECEIDDNESIRWSVGDCGSRIGIVKHDTNPWFYFESSYKDYLHYEVQFYKSKFKLVQLDAHLTNEKHLNAIRGANV